MGVDDASFTMELIDELTAPGRDMGAVLAALKSALGEAGSAAGDAGDALKGAGRDAAKAAEAMESAFKGMDAAMAHQNWVKMKRGQVETGKLNAEFKKMDDAMAHQKWVGLKRAEVQSNKAAFAAKQHADGLQRVAALGPPLDKLAMGAVAGVGLAAAGAALAVGAAVGVVSVKIGIAAIDAASFAQKSKLALTQLTGSAETAAAEFDDVRRNIISGLSVDDTVKSFQKLLAAQFSIGQSKDILKMGGDLQAIGTTAEGVQSAIQGITKIKNTGKLGGESLQQLQQAGLSGKLISDALQKSTGQDAEGVQKLISAGKIDADTGIAAIIEAVKHKVGEHELGEAGKKFADSTMVGFTSKLQDGMRNAMVDIGMQVEPGIGRILTLLSGTIDKLTKSGKLQQLSDTLVVGFQRFTNFIEQNWPAIESIIVGTIDFIIKGVWVVIDVLGFMADNWSTISLILKVVGVALGVVVAGALLMFAPFLLLTAAVLAIGAALAWVVGWVWTKLWPALVAVGQAWWDTVTGIVAPFKAAFDAVAAIFTDTGMSWTEKFFAIGQAIITGLINGITAMMTAPVDLVWNIGKQIIGAFKGSLDSHSPSELFKDEGIGTMVGFDIGVDKSAGKAIDSVAAVGAEITSAFSGALAMKPANDVTASPVAAALGVEAPTLQGANAQAASAAVQGVAAPTDDGGTSGGPISVTVQVSGADVSNPEQLGQTIGVAVRREIEAIFDKAS